MLIVAFFIFGNKEVNTEIQQENVVEETQNGELEEDLTWEEIFERDIVVAIDYFNENKSHSPVLTDTDLEFSITMNSLYLLTQQPSFYRIQDYPMSEGPASIFFTSSQEILDEHYGTAQQNNFYGISKIEVIPEFPGCSLDKMTLLVEEGGRKAYVTQRYEGEETLLYSRFICSERIGTNNSFGLWVYSQDQEELEDIISSFRFISAD